MSAVRLELRAIERGRNVCAPARMHAARAAHSSYAVARSRLLLTSVSTNCFQETGWERKRAPTENPWVKNVFLQLLDYFVLERWEREIIKQPRCIPALALGTPMLCYPRAPSSLPRPLLPHAAVGAQASAVGLFLRSSVLLPQPPGLLPALGTGAPILAPSRSVPGRVILPRSSAHSKCSTGSTTPGASGRAQHPAGLLLPCTGEEGGIDLGL